MIKTFYEISILVT